MEVEIFLGFNVLLWWDDKEEMWVDDDKEEMWVDDDKEEMCEWMMIRKSEIEKWVILWGFVFDV